MSRRSLQAGRGYRLLFIVAALAFSAPLAFSQAAGQWKGPEHIWNASCGYCHGAGVARELRGLNLPAELIRAFVRHGSSGMPVFRRSELSDAELAALARWLELSAPPRPAPPAPASP